MQMEHCKSYQEMIFDYANPYVNVGPSFAKPLRSMTIKVTTMIIEAIVHYVTGYWARSLRQAESV